MKIMVEAYIKLAELETRKEVIISLPIYPIDLISFI
jgi:hypothetical protein